LHQALLLKFDILRCKYFEAHPKIPKSIRAPPDVPQKLIPYKLKKGNMDISRIPLGTGKEIVPVPSISRRQEKKIRNGIKGTTGKKLFFSIEKKSMLKRRRYENAVK